MTHSTQQILNLVNFDVLIKKCIYKPRNKFNNYDLDFELLLLIGLVTGSKFTSLINLNWKDIVYLDSEDGFLAKEELIFRKYAICFHSIVKSRITETYIALDYPDLDSKILQSFSKIVLNSQNALESKIRILTFRILNLSNDYEKIYRQTNMQFDTLTQILFGRKVFEVNGYSNEICKKLKQHFDFRFNKELFDFLEYNSKDEIKYEISEINLDCNRKLFSLEDKNFNNSYSFQKFSVFSKFLFSKNQYSNKAITDSVIILLLMSLYNGIRPSTLIHLKWQDLIDFNDTNEKFVVKKFTYFRNYKIQINKEISKILINHFYRNDKIKDPDSYDSIKGMFYSKNRTHAKLTDYIFIMNSGNPLTQPSLSREIKKALLELKFPHYNKIKSTSTTIMYGRRIIEIRGDHKPTLNKLKEHFNFRSKKQLFAFLCINYNPVKDTYHFKGKMQNNIFEDILFDY